MAFSNVAIEEDEEYLVLYVGLHLEGAYNRECKDYAGLVNHGKSYIYFEISIIFNCLLYFDISLFIFLILTSI